MKIAVTYENGQVFQHFGHSEQFKVYTVENGQITDSQILSSGGSGHGALAGLLQNADIQVLICGGIGGGARVALAQAGINLYPGVTGDADAAVAALINNSLDFDPDTVCNHHEESGEHNCGEHHCGGNCHN